MATSAEKELQNRALFIQKGLQRVHPDARIALNYNNPLELLVATILSAQCTDVRVNIVTESLFKKHRTAADFASADPAVFEQEILSTGFFRQKTKAILAACKAIVEKHGGQVPSTMESLTALPGVGRKTANVVLGGAFGKPGIVVDTHVRRVSQRLGLTKNDDPEKIEVDLMALLPPKTWFDFCNGLIFHGRRVCTARSPKCEECFANQVCPSAFTFGKPKKTSDKKS